jgi:hypothetical protein
MNSRQPLVNGSDCYFAWLTAANMDETAIASTDGQAPEPATGLNRHGMLGYEKWSSFRPATPSNSQP